MKNIKLNTLFIFYLFVFIFLSFAILFINSYSGYKKLGSFSEREIHRNIKGFIDFTIKEDVKQQSIQLNSELQNSLDILKSLRYVNQYHVNADQRIIDQIKSRFEFNKKTDVYSYQDADFTTVISGQEFKFYSYYWGDAPSGNFNITANQIYKLSKFGIEIIKLISNPDNAIVDTFVISKQKYLIHFKNTKALSKEKDFNKDLLQNILSDASSIKFYENTPIYSFKSLIDENIEPITILLPVLDKNGEMESVVGVTLDRTALVNKIYDFFSKLNYENYMTIRLLTGSRGAILFLPFTNADSAKTLLGHSDSNLPDVAAIREAVNKNLDEFVKDSKDSQIDIPKRIISIEGEDYLAIYNKLTVNDWIILILIKVDELYRPLKDYKILIDKTLMDILIQYAILFLIVLSSAIVFSYILFRFVIIKPIGRLRENFTDLGKGCFDRKIEPNGVKEVFELSRTFNDISNELKNYTINLAQEIKERQSMETELEIASNLQKSVLPKVSNEFQSAEFMLFARLVAAKEMSGDFYDFFYVNEDLVMVIADVSGKGITAAFYMSMAKAIIREQCFAQGIGDTGKIVEKVNEILFKSVSSVMFLTLYLVVYKIKTGNVMYTNAGHIEYIKLSKGREPELKLDVHNTVVAAFADIKYGYSEFTLNRGDALVFLTDGITDAINDELVSYGVKRLLDLCRKNKSTHGLGDSIIEDVLNYQQGNKLDDITLLILERVK